MQDILWGEVIINICLEEVKYTYKAFGLNILSDFILEQLLPGDGSVEIEITNGKVPDKISDPNKITPSLQASKTELLFKINGIAKFYVANGKKVVVEPHEGVATTSIALFLLGIVFSVLLLQRGVLPIHGSAVVIDGDCVIFIGDSGAGKTTLSAALREKGHFLLTDDLVGLTFDPDGTIWVLPSYPQQKVWKDSANEIGVDVSSLAQVNPEVKKYFLPVHRGFLETPARLAVVCEIIPKVCREVSVISLQGMHKMNVLLENTYAVQLLRHLNLEEENFRSVAHVAKQVPVYRMVRPLSEFTTEKQIELIQATLKSLCKLI